ncbi:hypothetical protein [Xanthomarina sp. GH4-25]|uniref:hypothetical protein n=1 Tax=Xanthomarina sp. GH4-25 TaxID=3349335 RepID=UPI003877DCBB
MKLFRKIRADMIQKKKIINYILYAIGEISLIVIGIWLALYLQNKNEDAKIQETVQTSIRLLKDEIVTNRTMIDNVKDYHIMVRDTLQKFDFTKSEIEISKRFGFWKGVRTPRLQDAAFQTSIQTGVSKELNPKLLQALNNLYTYQDSYNNFTSQSTQIFFNADFTDKKSIERTLTLVKMTMSDLYYYEKGLTESFDYCLKITDSLYPLKTLK